jgi:serine phosphatase RsbU (regulator of sigma subunit)
MMEEDSTDEYSLRLRAGRDSKGHNLDELIGYSSTVVNQVFHESKPIVVTGTDQGRALGSESAVMHNLRSIMAVPLKVREKVIGVVYLDSHLAKGLFTEDDLDTLSAIANYIAIAFESGRMARVETDRLLLAKDLEMAAAAQTLFLPENSFFETKYFKLSGQYIPAFRASGDFWWFQQSENKEILSVLVGDVTGHGAASAMLTAATAGALQAIATACPNQSLDRTLTSLNAEFSGLARGKFAMTMSGLELDGKAGKLRVWNASAPAIFVLGKDGKSTVILEKGGPLGDSGFMLGTKEIDLKPGDRIFSYTDGLTELELPDGSQLRSKRVLKMLEMTLNMNLKQATEAITEGINDARGPVELKDDITFVLVDFQQTT